MTIGERIKLKRLEKEWSQRELSNRVGYSHHSTITRIEAGTVDLPFSKVTQFAKILGVTESYLMGWEEKEKKAHQKDELSPKRAEFIEKIKLMSDEELERLEKILALVENKG